MTEPARDLLEHTFASIGSLLTELPPGEWDLATECPGWSVRDIVSHLIGIERLLLGLPADPPLSAYPAHVKNDVGKFGEDAIAARRDRPGPIVATEFIETVEARLSQLRAMTTADSDRPGWSPIGEVPDREFMLVRAFDLWAHEQDIRRATQRPGHLSGPVAEHVLRWHRRNLPFVVGKRAGAPDGSSVRFVVLGPASDDVTVEVVGRARIADQPVPSPTATLTCDIGTYNALLCGRIGADAAIGAGDLTLSGDETLATTVARSAGYVF